MLKRIRLLDILAFKKNNGNNEVIEFGISDSNGSKASQY